MRIGLVTPGFSAHERDWCIPVLLNVVRALAREHDVQVFTLRYPHFRLSYRVAGATVHAFGGADTRGIERIGLLQRALKRILRLHRADPFDVVQGFWADEPGLVATAFGRLARVPSVVSVMGGELVSLPEIDYGGQLDILNPWLTRCSLQAASRVTVGSRYLHSLAEKQAEPNKLTLLPLGVDLELFTPEDRETERTVALKGKPAILTVGSLEPVKDHKTLFEAVAQLSSSQPEVHLHLVGDGQLRSGLQRFARSLCLDSHVTFHGDIPHHHLPAYYRAADLFVTSSRHESQGLAAVEAAASGCPVIGTAVGILPEISPRSTSISPGDPNGLARGIRVLLERPERLETLRTSSVERVRSELSLAKSVRRLVGIYRQLIGVT